MDLKEQSVLLFTRTMGLGGTENVVLQICETLKPYVKNIVVCSCGGVNEKKLKEMNIKHYSVPDITAKTPTSFVKILKLLKKIIKNENITIIHSHHRMAAFYTRIVSPSYIVQIANAHNTFFDKKSLTKFAYSKCNIIAVGNQVKKNLINFYGISSKKIKIIYNAIKPFAGIIENDKLLTQYRKNGYVLIGNVGRLSEQKGMTYFIDAAERLLETNKNVRFFIIGDGELKQELMEKVKKQDLSDKIIFMGYRSDVQNIISQLDFIVLSSLWEGLPLTPIEAFSVGKTVIATDVDGTPEIIKNNINGLLVKPKDSVQLSKKMNYLIMEENVRKKMELEARKTYTQCYSFEKMKREYIKYYEEL